MSRSPRSVTRPGGVFLKGNKMKKLTLFIALLLGISCAIQNANAAKKVALKKNQLITCPLDHKPVYRVAKTLYEGDAITTEHLIEMASKKHPKADQPFKCNALIQGWAGICIHTNQGWIPEACRKRMQFNITFKPLIAEPAK